jgi:hypothetical protein
MRAVARAVRLRLRLAARALRGFLRGFTGMPSARLAPGCAHDAEDPGAAARRALRERAARRPSCC